MITRPSSHAALRIASTTLLAISILFSTSTLAADETRGGVRYLEPAPLAELTAGDVAPVGDGALRLPVLGRGADLIAVHALEHGFFATEGLDVELMPGNGFAAQVAAARDGASPYLRGTVEMIQAAAEVFTHAGVELVVVAPLAWSRGGDALVARSSLSHSRDLVGKTIALQRHGPHVGYLHDLLRRAGASAAQVELRWLAEPTLPLAETGAVVDAAGAFLADPSIDAALVFAPDALALTSGGEGGSGAAGSVAGARILDTTERAARLVADVYAVRGDYLAAHPERVDALVRALDGAREKLAADLRDASAREDVLARAAAILLGSPYAGAEVAALVDGVEMIDPAGREAFFAGDALARLGASSRAALADAGLGKGTASLGVPARYRPEKPAPPIAVAASPTATAGPAKPTEEPVTIARAETGEPETVDEAPMAEVTTAELEAEAEVTTPEAQVTTAEAELEAEAAPRPVDERAADPGTQTPAGPATDLLRLAIPFSPNDTTFAAEGHARDFDRVHDALNRRPGARVMIEGRVDDRRLAAARRDGATPLELHLLAQQARNLALRRALAVRASLLLHCAERDATTDGARFVATGRSAREQPGGDGSGDPAVIVRVVETRIETRPQPESAP